jgi:hypothetical protein
MLAKGAFCPTIRRCLPIIGSSTAPFLNSEHVRARIDEGSGKFKFGLPKTTALSRWVRNSLICRLLDNRVIGLRLLRRTARKLGVHKEKIREILEPASCEPVHRRSASVGDDG